jgi:hypothetical protein
MSISHRQEFMGHFHIRHLQNDPQGSSKVKGQDVLLLIGQWQTFLFIGIMDLGAAVKIIRAIFTFVT